MQLLTLFLKYGLFTQTTPFTSPYFTTSSTQARSNSYLYTRQVTFRNLEMGTQQLYNLRQKFSLFFQTKTAILRYGQWLVVLVQWYSPMLVKTTNQKSKTRFSSTFTNFPSQPSNIRLTRFRHTQQVYKDSKLLTQTQYLF